MTTQNLSHSFKKKKKTKTCHSLSPLKKTKTNLSLSKKKGENHDSLPHKHLKLPANTK